MTTFTLVSSAGSCTTEAPDMGCGQVSAVVLVQLLGKSADPLSGDNPEGALSLTAVKMLVGKCGVALTGYKLNLSQIESLKRPVIAVVSGNHAVVMDYIGKEYVRLIDNGAPRLMRETDFEQEFAGIILAPDSYSPPPLNVESMTYLGALVSGQSCTVSITAVNVSDKPITAEFPDADTGCRSCGSAGTESRTFAPGERVVIERTFSAPRQGFLEEHLMFTLSTGHIVFVSIVGEVNSGFIVDPPSVDIGKVSRGTNTSVKVLIRRAGGLMPALGKVMTSTPWITESKEARSTSEVSLSTAFGICPTKAGPFREAITFKFAGGLQVVVPVEGEGLPYVYAVPATAVFGHIVLGSSAEWVCELQGSLADQSTPGSPDMPVEMSCAFLKEGNRWKVRLVLTPKEVGLFAREVVIHTGLAEQPELRIQALAFVKSKDDE